MLLFQVTKARSKQENTHTHEVHRYVKDVAAFVSTVSKLGSPRSYIVDDCHFAVSITMCDYNCSEAAEQVTRLPLPEDSSLEALGHVSHAFLRSAAKV